MLKQETSDHVEMLKTLGYIYQNNQSKLSQRQLANLVQSHLALYDSIKAIGVADLHSAYHPFTEDTAVDRKAYPIKLIVPLSQNNAGFLKQNLSDLIAPNQTIVISQGSSVRPAQTPFSEIILNKITKTNETKTHNNQSTTVFFMMIDLDKWYLNTVKKTLKLPISEIKITQNKHQKSFLLDSTSTSFLHYRNHYTLSPANPIQDKSNAYTLELSIDWGVSQIHWLPVLISLVLVFLIYVFILSLLQTIQRHTESLKINEQRFYQYFKNSHEAIIVTDTLGNIIYWNPKAENIFGYPHRQVLNKPLSTLLLNPEMNSIRFFENAIQSKDDHFEASLVTKNLETKHCKILVTQFIYRDKSEYALFIEDITKKKSNEAEIEKLAFYDPLTGLENRAYFTGIVNHYIQNYPNTQAAILFIDLDGFKEINDTQGHEFGDELLKIIGKRLKNSIRSADENVHLCRFGGDEFLILLGNISEKGAFLTADRLLSQLERSIKVENDELQISASIGVAFYPEHGTDLSTLLRHADTAMYEAKNRGKNTYAIYNHALEASLSQRIEIERSLRKAIENQEFELYYQPQINTQTMQVNALEALIRWEHPKLGFISPEEFIAVAENSGQIIEIGNWVLKTAVQQLKKWQSTEFKSLPIAINVSSYQLEKSNFIEQMHHEMETAQLPYELLEIELTERSIMSNANDNIELLHAIRSKGFTISVDDFGTGYSSLSYLKRFPLNALKVDKSFVDGLPHEEDDISISTAIINLSHSLSMKVIAEGVESKEQLDFLTQAGCDMVQGYYFSKPLEVQQLENWLTTFKAKGMAINEPD